MSLARLARDRRPDQGNALKRWIRNPGPGRGTYDFYELKRNTPKDVPPPQSTHTELEGGQYVVPADDNDEFLWHLAVSMQQDNRSSLVERRTEYFRYHLDLDFAEAQLLSLDDLRPYMLVVQEVVRRFFPFAGKDFLECAICAADSPKTVTGTDGKTQQIKSGFHILFPHIWVHTDQALAIRADLILHLTKKFGERKQPFKNHWSDVVDESVYVGSGLRAVGAVKVSQCKNPACRQKWKTSKKAPPPPPQIEGVHQKRKTTNKPGGDNAAAHNRSEPSSASKTSNDDVPISSKTLYRALTTSQSGGLNTDVLASATNALPQGLVTPGSEGGTTTDDCRLCNHKGRIIEGRPYYLVALWDFKCDDVTRIVKVPKKLASDTPRYNMTTVQLYPNAGHMSPLQDSNLLPGPLAPNVFYAMTMPHWLPQGRDDNFEFDDDDDADFDSMGLEPMRLLQDDEDIIDGDFVQVPLRDLVVFGDPRLMPDGRDIDRDISPEQAWEMVRKLHNTFRLTTLRSCPDIQRALQAHYERAQTDDSAIYDDTTKICPHFVRPHNAPAYSNRADALQRYNMGGGIFATPGSGVRLEHSAEAKWMQSISQGKKGYICDEEILSQVETCIRKNVGVRMDLEDPYPYGMLDVGAIIFNMTDAQKTPKPKSYTVVVSGFGSSYCINKGSSHNSNKIYFVINREGIHQRCHCTCNIDRKNGKCATFQSASYDLPAEVTAKLFRKSKTRGVDESDMDVAPRPSIVNFDPQAILKHLPATLPEGALSFSTFLKRKREQEARKFGLDNPEERLQKILVMDQDKDK